MVVRVVPRGKKLQLNAPSVAAVIEERFHSEKPGAAKDRLRVIRMVARGGQTLAQVADECGCSTSTVSVYLKTVREQGLDALLEINPGGRPEGWRKGIPVEVSEEFARKLGANEFTTMEDARRWLFKEHGIDAHYNKVWYWAKKLGGVVLKPRPSHSRKNPGDAEEFKTRLGSKFKALGLPQGTRAKVWVMDEARFGLHTMIRRVWGTRGKRPVVEAQTRYEWDYLYGSLDVTTGEAHFCQIDKVNLECDRLYLENLAASDPEAVHVLIRDQAGFHLRDGDVRLPNNVRIIDLPPYSPELNPCEQLWDLIKEQLGNRVFESIDQLREAMIEPLSRWWDDAGRVLSLVGRPWMQVEANASSKIF